MKKLLILLLVISLILAGCAGKETVPAEGKVGTAETNKSEEIIYVKVEPIGIKDFFHKLSLPGIIQPKETVMVTAKINGTVERIHGDIGSSIKKDALLCKLSDMEYKLQYENAVIGLNKEKLTQDSTKKNYERHRVLFESGTLSQADFENVENQYKMGQELLNLAQNGFALAKQNLDYTEIKAPISGVISKKEISVGENIGPGKMLFTIVSMDDMYVETGVSEKDIPVCKVGQKVEIRVESFGSEILEGEITHIGPVPDPETKAYPVKILVKNREHRLKAGMFATIEILLDSHKSVMSVPKEAIITENAVDFVFIEQNGKAYKKPIKVGYKDEDDWEVLEGIEKNNRVIVVGKDKLVEGNPITIRE
ncbi:efflux RND transporter periplasmic adaptor subunit [Anaerosolibacter sp.]|uniref:efflux RND transporter periplasmic adaptor subunit n=1 Tax=Anaerosolibacter sp. TaxID=1872527 RepID=UPI0039EE4EFE